MALAQDSLRRRPGCCPGFLCFGIALALVYAPMSTAAMAAMPAVEGRDRLRRPGDGPGLRGGPAARGLGGGVPGGAAGARRPGARRRDAVAAALWPVDRRGRRSAPLLTWLLVRAPDRPTDPAGRPITCITTSTTGAFTCEPMRRRGGTWNAASSAAAPSTGGARSPAGAGCARGRSPRLALVGGAMRRRRRPATRSRAVAEAEAERPKLPARRAQPAARTSGWSASTARPAMRPWARSGSARPEEAGERCWTRRAPTRGTARCSGARAARDDRRRRPRARTTSTSCGRPTR